MSEGQLWRQNYRDKAEMVGTRTEEGYVFFFSIYYLKLCVLYNLFRFVTKKNKFQKHTFKI